MIVADTNTIAYLIAPGGRSPEARALLRRDPDWHAPVLWRSEFANILVLMIRHQGLGLQEALRLMEKAERLLVGAEHRVLPATVVALAAKSGCTAYDCEFAALAMELGVPLVTSDKHLLKAFPDFARTPSKFLGS